MTKKNPESKIQSLNAGFFFLHLILKIVSTSKSLLDYAASVYTEKNISNYKTLTWQWKQYNNGSKLKLRVAKKKIKTRQVKFYVTLILTDWKKES